jgi:hypothetical protein
MVEGFKYLMMQNYVFYYCIYYVKDDDLDQSHGLEDGLEILGTIRKAINST